ncbi:rab-GTPase-TBC domain-domain-containing protein [Clohesyomyces aquaticus]|uniref:Rab-GTPase-TBC domain-domain-containing protein n=1 Tax=Clohesyomyces aquaticus TaxID=1231657 RepID=A0A1Y2A8F9_9PLEO|nr:rab-GTPase-TBC domain-domain-containing protein [Clohesyomyces aquaticus]
MEDNTPPRSVSSASLGRDADASSVSGSQASIDPLSAEKEAKAVHIAAACENGNLGELIDLATSAHGLVDDSLRRTAWPLLLGCTKHASLDQAPWSTLPAHRDESQVALDVHRAFVYYPSETGRQLDRRKEQLSDVIVEVLRRYPALCYFQGYHDIVQVFLLVLGAQDAPAAVARLSVLRIRDFMLPSLDPAISHLLLLPPIIRAADPDLYNHLPRMKPFFALGATITLFAHVIQAYGDISRLFDFFLACDTVVPVYFFAAVLLSRKEELLDIEKDEVDMFHATLGKLPQNLDLEFLVAQALQLYQTRPPQSLHSWAWWSVSSASVLKATRSPFDVSKLTMEDGIALFRRQEADMRRKQTLEKAMKSVDRVRTRMWYYRRPGAYGLAVLVGVYAIWLGRNAGVNVRFTAFERLGNILKQSLDIFV